MKLFIAEDEAPARERLLELIGRVAPQAVLLGHADSVQATRDWLAAHAPPDLLLLDIQLADGLSLELFRDRAPDCPVIFTTAYDQFALQAFQALAVDYLLKPIADAALARAFAKAGRLRAGFAADVAGWLATSGVPAVVYRQRLLGRQGGQPMHVLPVAQLAYLVSVDKLAFAVMADGRRYLLDGTLADLALELDPARFFRASRQVLVAASAIAAYSPAGKGRLRLDLRPRLDDELLVSQERAAEFKAWLQQAPA
ncbi:LytTR family DNA-binding domain-containing protein [Ottowia sp.]|uniref:LytR/AlgR family response regulator transcription factor n=1 Tax=Ottowia sp. TaxID=1898956 RepID=UPI002C9C6C28|nr:LytTR family DNA-binding domain-containing protein [Ottowia sp.]HNR84142.1 LytTR family DNA-binding domain-containing protein [Ottowia sp.]HNT85684.1 LytTR family DNA-binding domain-containing protein [Ottowia sp.]